MRKATLLLSATILIAVSMTAAISLQSRFTPANRRSISSDPSEVPVPDTNKRHRNFRREYPVHEEPAKGTGEEASNIKISTWKRTTEKTLAEAGWTRQALDRVSGLNAEWFETLAKDDHDAFEEQIRCLKRLGCRPRVMDFLRIFPETAGLLAAADQPEKIIEVLDTDDSKRVLLMGLFVRNVGRRDIAALAAALEANRDLICQLLQRGLIGAEVLFMFPRTGPGSVEYERWLQDNLTIRLAGSDDDMASFVQFVLLQGRDLLERLDKEKEFRERFRVELWPKLMRVVSRKDEALEFYMDEPELWSLLALERGEELLERRGLLAVTLLFGQDAFAKEFEDRIVTVLLSGDGVTFQALTEGRFRKEALFFKLLNRPLTGPVLAAALNRLFEEGAGYRPLLEKFNRLNDEILTEEVGPPPEGMQTWLPLYSQYMIGRKLIQGRKPSTEDLLEAGVDTAIDLAALLFPPAKGGKLMTQTVKNVGGKAVKKELGKEVVEMGLKAARKRLTQEATKELAKPAMERQARKWVATRFLTEMQGTYRRVIMKVEKITSFEITSPVRFFYETSNLGRGSYKTLTQLEARIFMRGDGMVFVHIDRLASEKAKDYLNEWLKSEAKKVLFEASEEQRWKRHISSWWLLNTGAQAK